ncbi:MAG: hypothetical protein A3I79_02605 [Gemmatimonadetes bacterium RIFCSPLOWO2_02_FULL_71_11]|nr:MAG: hypothetical protein A3I79_02605 [Gemmatimonadetes bacterium RIFCSPLOWO2_02_FULL_71_11]
MTRLGEVSLFLLGMYLSMRAVAASYRVLDLWYAIGTEYPAVIRGLLGWGGTTVAIAVLLGRHHRNAFLCGLLAFLLFYLGIYGARHLFLRKPAPTA